MEILWKTHILLSMKLWFFHILSIAVERDMENRQSPKGRQSNESWIVLILFLIGVALDASLQGVFSGRGEKWGIATTKKSFAWPRSGRCGKPLSKNSRLEQRSLG